MTASTTVHRPEEVIAGLRAALLRAERNGPDAARLFAHEAEYLAAPDGISIVVPVHNGAAEMGPLLLSLRNQSLARNRFEVVFALNGCTDGSRAMVDDFAAISGVATVVLDDPVPSVARARNAALQRVRFRQTTFVDHDDHLSRDYLAECVVLGDCRSVVVANIVKLEGGNLVEDYAQTVVAHGFETSHVHGPHDIDLCYRTALLHKSERDSCCESSVVAGPHEQTDITYLQ
ncbi:Glycosyl transferase family 2, partial [Loktanella fryxellensis]